jgi:hypothetical protein
MRNVLAASLLVVSALVNTGCPGFCGGLDGAGDVVYERNTSEMLIVCNNGGYVATLQTRQLEGRIQYDVEGHRFATTGEDGALAFDFVDNYDGTASTPQLGEAMWTEVSLDAVALDHAHVLCTDLEARAWWTGGL